MLPRKELLKIALAHARAGARFLYDERGKSVIRLGYETNLIGLFIPASTYYATEKVESMLTYEMRRAGLICDNGLEFINGMDKINILDDKKWVEALERKINDECKTGDR